MKKFSLALAADVLFYSVAAWLLAVGLLRYFRAETWVCMTAATLIALAVGGGTFCLLSAKREKRLLGKKEREERDALLLHLALEKDERVRALLLTALAADGREAHCSGDALALDGNPLVPLYTMEPVSADAVAQLVRRFGSEPFIVACNALTPEAEKLLTSFGKEVMNGDETYALFSRTKSIPEKLLCGDVPRRTAKTRLRAAFAKRNARPFFVSGFLLLIMSLFVIYPVYYLVTGSVLMIAAIIVRATGFA